MKNVFVVERNLDLGMLVTSALDGMAYVTIHSGAGSPKPIGPVDLAFIVIDGNGGGAEALARSFIAQAIAVVIVAEGPETPIPADLIRAGILINPLDDGDVRNIFTRLTSPKSSPAAMLERTGTWKAVLDQLSEGVILTDAAGAIIYVNDAAERLHGVRKLDIAPDDYTETYHLLTNDGEPHPVETLPLSRAVMSGENVSGESWRIRRPDGSEVVAVGSARRIYGDSAEMIGAVLTVRDDTERWASERRLSRSEERFRALADNIPTLCWMANAEGWIFWYNQRWYDYTGTTEEGMRGWGWQSVHDPDVLPEVMRCWTASISTGQPFEMIFPLKSAEGPFRSFLTRVIPIHDDAGTVKMWFGTNTDITDLKAARDSIEASEQRYRSLIEVSPQVVFFADPAGRVTYTNFYWHEYTGQSPNQALDAGWTDVLHPDHRERVLLNWSQAIKAVVDFEVETPFQRADGEYRWFVARAVPVLDGHGNVEQWIGVAIDIHDRKQAEEAQELLSRELSHRIKNIFALVIGLANLTGRNHPEAANYITALRTRIQALAKAHDLVRPDQRGASMGDTGSLHDLIRALVAPYEKADGRRVTVAGDDIRISVKAATSLALIIHEQATNAAKYGALQTEDGTVTIVCQANGDKYSIVWQERGGPPVLAKPGRQGFGTVLAARTVVSQLDGVVEHDWSPEGLTVSLAFPPDRLSSNP